MMQSYVTACLRSALDESTDASFHDGRMAQQAITAVELATRQLNQTPSHVRPQSLEE